MTKRKLRAADLFCGAGGSTLGAKLSGKVDVVLAVNHWHTAIQSHRANHPETHHICARIDDIDPRHDRLPDFDVLMASPECTHHSNARGGRPMEDQKRAGPWDVCKWAEARRPKYLIVENVREFQQWGPLGVYGRPLASRKGETYQAWLNALGALGYTVETRILNAADYGEATKRHRLFIMARRGPYAPTWPAPTHAGRWRAAAEVIEWDRPCPSIFGRKVPLADKTLLRILAGLEKFVGPYVVTLRNNANGSSPQDPLGAVTAGGLHHGVAVPFQLKASGCSPGLTKGIDTPLPTIVAAALNHAVVVPYLVPNFGEREGQGPRTHDVDAPMPTVTSRGGGNLVSSHPRDSTAVIRPSPARWAQ